MSKQAWDNTTAVIGMILIFVFGLIVGVIIGPEHTAAPSVGNDRVVEKPVLFDPPLKKGVENLNWEY